jgi:DNA-binding response OmpR family regulator
VIIFIYLATDYDLLLLDWHLINISDDYYGDSKNLLNSMSIKNIQTPLMILTVDDDTETLRFFNENNLIYMNKPLDITQFLNILRLKFGIDTN